MKNTKNSLELAAKSVVHKPAFTARFLQTGTKRSPQQQQTSTVPWGKQQSLKVKSQKHKLFIILSHAHLVSLG